MASSDALLVVEDWISEHYFTTDARGESFRARTTALRKSWDQAEESIRSRFTAARPALVNQLARLGADDQTEQDHISPTGGSDLHRQLRQVFGYETGEFVVTTDGPLRRYQTPGVTGAAPLVIIEAAPCDAVEDLLVRDGDTLATPWVADDSSEGTLTSVARTLSRLFTGDEAPAFALVMAGRWLVVTDRDRWPEGRHLAVDLQTVAERNDTTRAGEVDRALACVGADSLAPDADGTIWWSETLDASKKHAVGVSADLREGVRLSIEIIANEVVRRRAARGWPPLPAEQAQPLAIQSLRFLYRILFLLYAEASPELGVLPVGATEYDAGYSLDRLRELTLVELVTPQAKGGTHLYDSLAVLFRLVDKGHDATTADPVEPDPGEPDPGEPDTITDLPTGLPEGLTFHALRADLFSSAATSMISEVRLGNDALQQVLQHLMLSKEQRGKDRGFISYVELGINQLGAVYEGLMSYTGSFATTDLYEVARGGDNSKGSWVVPVDRADDIAEQDFVTETDDNGESRPVIHRTGMFVFRLSGRERQQSASYYTPEVLTRFTVSQALAELIDQDGHHTTADEILDLSVCEPALGSGAFALEAVRQLAELYLSRREAERGERIDPDQRPAELRRAKASIALHQVYGVDLNATAVELAEISLWLDSMAQGLRAPWFGLRLRRGNSLVGARHAVHTRDQVATKQWLTLAPDDIPLTALAAAAAAGVETPEVRDRIHHFLVPAAGWGSATEAKEARTLAPERAAALKKWRAAIKKKPSRTQLNQLGELSRRVDVLWQQALRRLRLAEQESRRPIQLWGMDSPTNGAVTREQIEAYLHDADSAYQRLRLVMDAWCALWWWPLHGDPGEPPTLDAWIAALQGILGRPVDVVGSTRSRPKSADQSVISADNWDEMGEAEALDHAFADAHSAAKVLADHPWLTVCQAVAGEQGFFHWELDFAPVFARGGFDLQVGNPPWVRPRTDTDALLAESDPWWALAHKPSETARRARRDRTLESEAARDLVAAGDVDVACLAAYTGDRTNYEVLAGLQPDLYRCFMAGVWRNAATHGVSVLIHYETHFTDERAGAFREQCYERLRRHYEFINELLLFEIEDHKHWGVSVFSSPRPPSFLQAAVLYHPSTVERSVHHDGSGPEPGFKDDDGNWDQRPHRNRLIRVDDDVLRDWHAVLETSDTPVRQTRMLYTVNRAVADVLSQLATAPRVQSIDLEFSRGWDESIDRKKGRFVQRWGGADSWREVILQGPHLHVNAPFYKAPNPTMKHNQDWSPVDLETLPADAIPVTAYKPSGSPAEYDAAYTHWGAQRDDPARDHYRVAWRRMAANTGERTLIPALIPPGPAHVDGVFSAGSPSDQPALVLVLAHLSSLLVDVVVRSVPKGDIRAGTISRLPFRAGPLALQRWLRLRTLRLNAVSDAYATMWGLVWEPEFERDSWVDEEAKLSTTLGEVSATWTSRTPLRRDFDRYQAQVEIDALAALMLGVTADQLCTVYRTQFAVLRGYDQHTYYYDANGRLVPNVVLREWRKKGDRISEEERTHPFGEIDYTYELPFATRDREVDMRHAYAVFEQRLAEEGTDG